MFDLEPYWFKHMWLSRTWYKITFFHTQEHELQTQESSINTDDTKTEIATMTKDKSYNESKISELK